MKPNTIAGTRPTIELIEEYNHEKVVLFIGKELGSGQQSILQGMSQRLAESGYPVDDLQPSFSKLAQYYELKFGRNALITFLRDRCEESPLIPKELCHLIASMRFPVLVTTSIDRSLERALVRAGTGFKRVVSGIDIGYLVEEDLVLVKLHGSLDQPESLVLTEKDQMNRFRQVSQPLGWLEALFATKTLLFVGYDLNDHDFLRLYGNAIYALDRHSRRSYAVQIAPSEYSVSYWQTENLSIVDCSASGFLRQVQRRASSLFLTDASIRGQSYDKTGVDLTKRPYKFLDFFGVSDSDIFFGRRRETKQVISRVLSSRLTILYGKSGTGKTSLIHAGIIPQLTSQRYVCVYVRVLQDPVLDVKRSIKRQVLGAEVDEDDLSRSLSSFLWRMTPKMEQGIVVIVDQFEEFFIRHGKHFREQFIDQVRECYDDRHLRVKFLLSLREDFLAELTEFESHIPAVFYNHFRLKKLRVEQARRSILGPASKFDFHYEDRVVEELLEVLSEGGIDPPQLQIICDKLYDTLTEDDRTIDWNKYQRVGGGKGILSKYLQDVVDSFSLQQRDTVREVLKELVTYTGTKGILFLDALSRKLDVEKEVIADVLKRLIRARLVRPYDDGVKEGFELTHEYLTEEINDWISDEEIQLKAAESLLRQEFDSWKRFGTMMEVDKLRIIDDQRDHLALEENFREKAFILLASVNHDYEFEYWLEQNKHSSIASQWLCDLLGQAQVHASSLRRAALAVGLLGTRSDLFRERALETLREVGNPHLFPILEAYLQSEDKIIASFAYDAIDAIKSRFLSDMIYIEAGEFIMGSNEEEVESLIQEYGIERSRLQGEIPRRHASLEGFWIDKYPVTNAQYKEFDPGYEYPEGKEDHPAVNLNYNHALAYAQWLGKELPTEREWEKAARGTDGRLYPWGDDWDAGKCNTHEGGINESTPVSTYTNGASPYGCLDMAGNVWEWVDSWFDEQSGLRVAKGGGWAAARLWARCAARHRTHFTSQFHLVGFRCVIRD